MHCKQNERTKNNQRRDKTMNEIEKAITDKDDELIEVYLASVSPDDFRNHIEEIKAKASNGVEHLSKLKKIAEIINKPTL